MSIITPLIDEEMLAADNALRHANSDNIVELCGTYLRALSRYRDELYKLQGLPEISLQQRSGLALELTQQVRRAIRSALEICTRERNQTELLLQSFTAISGYQAVDTFNQLRYQESDEWQLGANSIRSRVKDIDLKMTMQEGIEKAGWLRRGAYIRNQTVFY